MLPLFRGSPSEVQKEGGLARRERRQGEAGRRGPGAGGCRRIDLWTWMPSSGGGLAQSREGERSLLASLSLLLLLEEKGMQDDADNDMEQTQGRGDIVRVVSPS